MSPPDSCVPAEEVDLLVFGAGAGGMTAALVASLEGLNVLLCEKTGQVGGITATSGGTAWVPGTDLSIRAGVPDSTADAAAFLASVVGNRGGDALRQAFLDSGPAAIRELDEQTDAKFVAASAHPDYLGNHPGAAFGGRALAPLPFDGRLLGRDFARIRPPRPEFMGPTGMMVARNELDALLRPFASLAHFKAAAGLLLRQAADRLRYPRGTRLVMGNALVARLFYSLRQRKVPVRFDTALRDLIVEQGRVVGARVDGPAGPATLRARYGVVLATGGIAHNPALRARLFPQSATRSLAPDGNTGDGVSAASRIGAPVDAGGDSPALWMPTSVLNKPQGAEALWPHILLDRAKPGLIAVNAAGRRFVNESDSYHDFVMGMLRAHETAPSVPAHLICDAAFLQQYGLGLALPGAKGRRRLVKAGYLIEAPDLPTLAARIGVDAAALQRTVERHNGFAQTGVDADFGRGTSPMNRFNGDPAHTPNPCMRPIATAPYYAVAVWPADLAASAGLQGDVDGRVLDESGAPIAGLFACGNDLASIFRGTYPGPGTTIGPAMVFGWRIAKAAAKAAHLPS
ncbi:MAG TPA: FAD-binding protein [Novosphingobium sp.]|nr:FAD-binding protein [Novosphingobium sp.]HZV09720.1 FAD-binding protein [Novosphingobium sp.]